MTKFLLALTMLFAIAQAGEHPIGEDKVLSHINLGAVYLQPIDMEPRGISMPASKSDVHLELDAHATKGNTNGFGAGEWIPYLTVSYVITNLDTGKSASGALMPMVASDGPHYGANIKMLGIGNYKVDFTVYPPSRQGFGRHTDKESGVGKWFKPFTVSYKGAYKGL